MNILNPTINKEKQGRLTGSQQGFALILTMVFLVILSLIGITAIRSSRVDVQIAGNERWATDSFYRSESGGDMTTRLLEDMARGKVGGGNTTDNFVYGEVLITNIEFDLGKPQEEIPRWTETNSETSLVADVFIPKDNISHSSPYTIIKSTQPLTQVIAGKSSKKPVGTSVETGRSGSSPSSPPQAIFDIWSRNRGLLNSESIIHTRWLHID